MLKLRDKQETHLWEKTVHRYVEHGLPMADAVQHADAYIVARRDRYAADDPSPDRWEVGFRNIVTFVLGPRATFEIDDVVERVRVLTGCDGNGDPIAGQRDADAHARVLVQLATTGRLCTTMPLPWTAERMDDYTHAWQIRDSNDECVEYLAADVDGPGFVAWMNEHAPVRGDDA